jgi:hypothetical protein
MKDKVNQEVHKRLAHLLDSDLQTIFVLWDAAPTYRSARPQEGAFLSYLPCKVRSADNRGQPVLLLWIFKVSTC